MGANKIYIYIICIKGIMESCHLLRRPFPWHIQALLPLLLFAPIQTRKIYLDKL